MNKYILIPIAIFTINSFAFERKDYALIAFPVMKTSISSLLAIECMAETIWEERDYFSDNKLPIFIGSMIYGIPNALLIANAIKKDSRLTKLFRRIVMLEELVFASTLFISGMYLINTDETKDDDDGFMSGIQSAIGEVMVLGSMPIFTFSLFGLVPYSFEKRVAMQMNFQKYSKNENKYHLVMNFKF